MPPGVKSGQAFVHDPKSAGQSNVKASIKLRFTNRGGNKMVVVRSMEVTQKKTTLTFKALDGVLRTTNPETGERISMSHKCTELDRQIPTMIGVRLVVGFTLPLILLTLYSRSNIPPFFCHKLLAANLYLSMLCFAIKKILVGLCLRVQF